MRLRPKNLDDVVGQDVIIKSIKCSLNIRRVHCSYCFIGARGTGKTTTARLLSKCFNCLRGITLKPCNKCAACLDIDLLNGIDYLEIDAATHRGVENMILLLEGSSYAPAISKFRIYAIDEAQMLTPYAFCSLLKVLEEPPKHVKFILCTTDIKKIPTTILSRSINLHFSLLKANDLKNFIIKVLKKEGIRFSLEVPNLLAELAGGSIRDCLSITERVILLSDKRNIRTSTIERALAIPKREVAFSIIKSLYNKDIRNLNSVVQNLIVFNHSIESILHCIISILNDLILWTLDPTLVNQELIHNNHLIKLHSEISGYNIMSLYKIILEGLKEKSIVGNNNHYIEITLMRLIVLFIHRNIPD